STVSAYLLYRFVVDLLIQLLWLSLANPSAWHPFFFFFFLIFPPPPRSTLFPYTTLFRSGAAVERRHHAHHLHPAAAAVHRDSGRDRKSTRLNSSHSQISYAVFCLKKKNKD